MGFNELYVVSHSKHYSTKSEKNTTPNKQTKKAKIQFAATQHYSLPIPLVLSPFQTKVLIYVMINLMEILGFFSLFLEEEKFTFLLCVLP
jgi:hypothetical protein